MTAFLIGLAVGLVSGVLIMRKHAAKASDLEARGKALLAALKGK